MPIKFTKKQHKRFELVLIGELIYICGIIAIGILYELVDNAISERRSDDKNIIETKTEKPPSKTSTDKNSTPEETDNEKVVAYSGTTQPFPQYKEETLNFTPQMEAYSVEPNLANVTNKNSFTFSEAAAINLEKNAFVVISGEEQYKDFSHIYEINRYDYIPSFITTDSILHAYHLLFERVLKSVEQDHLIRILKDMNKQLLTASQEVYANQDNELIKTAAKRNTAFFAAGSALLDESIKIPSFVQNEVAEELNLISKHSDAYILSPVMTISTSDKEIIQNYEDYTQYIPRGHYTKTEDLKKYFKAMMWYGRMTFRQATSSENMSALLITYEMQRNQDIAKRWNAIYEPTSFFVGKADNLSYYDYAEIVEEVFGKNPNINDFADTEKFKQFEDKISELEAPAINSLPTWSESSNSNQENKIKGLRFMGQRYTIDASIFQNLLFPSVQTNSENATRSLPKSLDILAAMGSDESYKLLIEAGDTDFAGYTANMTKTKEHVASLPNSTWTQNLYWGWLYSLKPLSGQVTAGYPSFMTNTPWVRKDMNTYLGSWTELKHDTILYAQQIYAEMGEDPRETKDVRGFVEPRPYVYSHLAALTAMTIEGLQARELIDDHTAHELYEMVDLTTELKEISIKELENTPLSNEDYEFIEYYGGQLEHFGTQMLSEEGNTQNDPNPTALIADVATGDGLVLEEGIGAINPIFVIIPIDGKLRIAKGGVFSYYEFSWPVSDRLTDEKWQTMISKGGSDMPEVPEWTNMFLVKE